MSSGEGSAAAPDRSGRTWAALDIDGLSTTRRDDGSPVAIHTDLVEAALMDFDVSAIQETSDTSRRIFFASAAARDAAAAALSQAFPPLTFEPVDVPDEDWAARS